MSRFYYFFKNYIYFIIYAKSRDGQIAPPANVRPAVIVSLVKPANRPLPTRSGAVGCPG